MKILIASDIHGRVQRMKMLEERNAEFHPDCIFLLGDYLYNGPRNGVP
ncbi:MAG TPA: phosphodiesterase, partial [Firmicutes bacterium]|nr:phosphodiesterase [Bacillota bacterium]